MDVIGLLGDEGTMMLRLFVATLLGGAIGWERVLHHRPAGLRTHSLVCAGSALFTAVSIYGFGGPQAGVDTSRVAAQIVTGIGFLGAGTILRGEQGVSGLTTAGGLWYVAAIGMVIGAGMYATGIFATLIGLVVLGLLRRWVED